MVSVDSMDSLGFVRGGVRVKSLSFCLRVSASRLEA